MPKTVTVQQSTADEITQWMSGGIRTYPSPEAAADWLAQVVPPVVVLPPPGDWQPAAIAAALAAGFDSAICLEWDWTSPHPPSYIDSWDKPNSAGGTGLETNGIMILRFIPNHPADNNNQTIITTIGYKPPNMGNETTMAIATTPATLLVPQPGTSTGTGPTLNIGVGTVANSGLTGKPSAVALIPGVAYHLNVAGRTDVRQGNPFGTPTCVPSVTWPNPRGEVRVTLRKPPGH